MIPRTSAAQKKANKPMETVNSLSTVVIWSTGTLPPEKKYDMIIPCCKALLEILEPKQLLVICSQCRVCWIVLQLNKTALIFGATRILKRSNHLLVILDLCLRKLKPGKTHHYCYVIVPPFAPFLRCFSFTHANATFSNSSRLQNVFEKLFFRDGLVRTAGLTLEIVLRFQFFFCAAQNQPVCSKRGPLQLLNPSAVLTV